MIHKSGRTPLVHRMGPFVIRRNHPGRAIAGHNDHGFGPLAAMDDSSLDPGTHIRLHEHSNEEIVSYIVKGVMRHRDTAGYELDLTPATLMVMNAGESFWHEERTLHDDEPTRVLQIFVRPHALDLEPGLQFRELEAPEPGRWRQIFGPEGSGAASTVRNRIALHDIVLPAGADASLPVIEDWDTYFYVFDGAVEAGGEHFGDGESGLVVDEPGAAILTRDGARLVAFQIDRNATVTREGTIGR